MHALWLEAGSSHLLWIELAIQIEPRGNSTAWNSTVSSGAWAHSTVQHMDADMWLKGAWLSFDDQTFHQSFFLQTTSKSESLEVFVKIIWQFVK